MSGKLKGYTAFISYMLMPDTLVNLINTERIESLIFEYDNSPSIPLPSSSIGIGNNKYIHCNYINKIILDVDNPYVQELSFKFNDINDFKFLSDNIRYGYTAKKIYALIQIVDNSTYTNIDDVSPKSYMWRKYDLTHQINNHIIGEYLTGVRLTSKIFKIPLNNYKSYPLYNINDYITYPNNSINNDLGFGDETYLIGNINTDIKSEIYSMDLSINLGVNEYNYSTNNTWNNNSDVIISEIGIYDEDYNLVAIGKLNNPIVKNNKSSRIITFNLDF